MTAAQSPFPRRARARARASGGYILITGLLFLVVMTLLGVSLFRGTGLMNRISANTRDKERSFEAAQAALQYGEWWLASGYGGVGGTCAGQGMVNGNTLGNVQVCSESLTTPTALPWTNGFNYTPPNLVVASGGGIVSGTNPDINYQGAPGFYVEHLGLSADGKSQVYQVTAFGRGGDASTATVVRSTYQVTPATKPLDGL